MVVNKIQKFQNLEKYKHLTETYIVTFWLKEDNFWFKTQIEYFTENKGSHELVKTKFQEEHKNYETELVNIIYQ